MLSIYIVYFFGVIELAASLSLPSYIKACSKSDPNFEKCAIDSATKAMPFLAKGDRKYGLVSVKPLVIPEVKLKSPNMELTLKNLHISGLENSVFEELKLDIEKEKKGKIVTRLDKAVYDGDYEVDGHIMVFPIKGSGRAHFELHGGRYEFYFDLEITKRDGDEYMKLVNPTAKYTLTKAIYKFDNLFGGDERLGNELNKVLNENWESVNKDISGSFSKTNAEVCVGIANAIITKVPLKEIFLD